ncbi:UNVERIFIED_CONTAM: hypothetical protein GTU68_037646 [Idotea baltica]|nr:hypothetical protein [Idotea baltica]
MLINAVHSEEVRIAIVEDGNLSELEVESNHGKKLKGNVYKTKITRIEPSLQAAFIDIGTQRNGFLQINDIHPSYFNNHDGSKKGFPSIQDVLSPGQEIVVQALVAIDVNSGKATTGGGIEETAFRTNLEACDEVARQLRLRDLGGLIVIDFIDMLDRKHRFEIEKRMNEVVKKDKARIEIGKLSKFGLLEMSRQRLRASLSSQSSVKCPNCSGSGRIKSSDIIALEALRKIQGAITVGKDINVIKARMSPSPALFLLNNKKTELVRLEQEYEVKIYVLADGRVKPDDIQFEMESKTSKIDNNIARAKTTSKGKAKGKPRRKPVNKSEKAKANL